MVSDWIAQLKQTETSSLYCIWNLYMKQFEELSSTGTVPDRRLYLNRSTYDRLCETMKSGLDDYLLSCKDHYTDRSWILARNILAGMLLFFEDLGRDSFSEISYPEDIYVGEVALFYFHSHIPSGRHAAMGTLRTIFLIGQDVSFTYTAGICTSHGR